MKAKIKLGKHSGTREIHGETIRIATPGKTAKNRGKRRPKPLRARAAWEKSLDSASTRHVKTVPGRTRLGIAHA